MYTFEFNLEDYKYVALKVLEEDRTLAFMRSKLVPKKYTLPSFFYLA